MAKVALGSAGTEPVPVRDASELRAVLEEARPRAVVVDAADLAAAGLDASTVARLAPGATVILVGPPRPRGEPLPVGVRHVVLPFAVRDLVAALPPDRAPAPAPERGAAPADPSRVRQPPAAVAPSAEAIAEQVRAEVERLVGDSARRIVGDVARRVVPELAEAIIRRELERLLREAGDAAVADPAGDTESE